MPYIVVLALLSLLVLAAEPLPPPTPTPSKQAQEPQEIGASKQQAGATNNHPTEELAPAVNLLKAENHEEQAAQQGDHHSDSAPPSWITWFTGALALLALCQFIAMAVQAWLYRKALRLDQRPWIVPTGDIHLGLGDGLVVSNTALQFRVDLKNTGKTPALRLEIAMKWIPIRWTASDQAPSGDYPDGQRRQLGAIGPGLVHQHWVVSYPVVTQPMHEALFGGPHLIGHHPDDWLDQAPPQTLLICGEVKYRDQFCCKKPHVTKFCFLRLDIGQFVATGPYNECT